MARFIVLTSIVLTSIVLTSIVLSSIVLSSPASRDVSALIVIGGNKVNAFAERNFRRKVKREWDVIGRNKNRCGDLRRHDFEVETRLVAGRSGAAKSFPLNLSDVSGVG